ncbi:alpha/beta hydrolase [Marivita sp. GX14005]|uniref:alpha/beta fold hydrolase n=1 Tax=Marivita sp. GX14005 TaxID=2942276 RepID=UPI00201948F4|nr:alpha/beta hydrolase [Marivita sp. GX14005]MCL3883365.1 alpha/beta hydrolase [Marivita sp. GX14005]
MMQNGILPHRRSGQGVPFVLVHGYLGGSAQWQAEIAHFSDRFDVIAPDLPGFGEASSLRGCDRIGDMAAAILGTLDGLGVTEFILMGHSMGGMIAQEIAARAGARVRKLILYGTGPLGLMPDRFEPIGLSRERLGSDGIARTVCRIGATWFRHGEEAPGFAVVTEIGQRANPQAARAALDAMAEWDGRAALSRLGMPTLVVWGHHDQSYKWPQVETLWRNLPNATLSVIPGASHAAHLEKPRLFHATIEDFLFD